MCGIAGIINTQDTLVDRLALEKMGQAMIHRGPDDEGIYLKGGTGLIHRRLSIIDLETGHQPISNEDGSVHIIANGEIYNFKELRKELEGKGHSFSTNSDTEAVLHAYEEYGEDGFLPKLRGMFAIAIWNEREKKLVLGRDRLGQKPLLWYEKGGRLIFASEFTGLLAEGSIKREMNFEAIYHYLTFMAVPAPLTAFGGVNRLMPGSYLVYRDGRVIIKQYWQLKYKPKNEISLTRAEDEIMELLSESIKLRLVSDVDLGILLSGGVDSSAILALAAKNTSQRLKTFSIGFEESSFNELPYARKVAKYFDTDHEEFIIEPKAVEILPELVKRYGEPFADSSAIPSYYVSKMAASQVKVVLNGDGGDEIFAGYRRHLANHLAARGVGIPGPLLGALSGFSKIMSAGARRESWRALPARYLSAHKLNFNERYLRWVGVFNEEDKMNLLSDSFRENIADINSVRIISSCEGELSALDEILFADTNFNLANDLLVKIDIASMANSLEARSPFLDHRLVEYVAQLPSGMKINNNKLKFLLKEVLGKLMPAKLIRRKKQGFAVPIGQWFRSSMKDFLKDHLLSGPALKRDYFNIKTVEGLIKGHLSQAGDYSHQLWTLLMLELWQREFID